MNDQDLADVFSEGLDLLDRMVDPLLEIGVCKARVVFWKTTMRETIARERAAEERKLRQVQKYIGDLCFKAPEVFPSGMEVQFEVGHILGMWGAKS